MHEDIISFAEKRGAPFYVSMCGISYCDSSYKICRRNSEINVIEYIISGTGAVLAKDKIFYPEKDDIYFLKRGEDQIYYADGENPWVKIWLNFAGSLADGITKNYCLTSRYHFHAPHLKKYFFDMYKIANSGCGINAVNDRCAVIFLKLAQELAAFADTSDSSATGAAGAAKRYIDDTNDFSLTLDDVAEAVSYSKNHIIREFKSEYGTTPYEYMLCRRFDAAESLLKNTAYPIREIAEKLNFCDARYFSRSFSKKYGITPGAYRKKYVTGI